MADRPTGPGAACWCDCGRVIPAGHRKHAKYIDSGHRARASEARKARRTSNPSGDHQKALESARRSPKRAVPDRVVASFVPIDAMAALGGLRALACALSDPTPLAPAIDCLEHAVERRRQRLTNQPRQETPDG